MGGVLFSTLTIYGRRLKRFKKGERETEREHDKQTRGELAVQQSQAAFHFLLVVVLLRLLNPARHYTAEAETRIVVLT